MLHSVGENEFDGIKKQGFTETPGPDEYFELVVLFIQVGYLRGFVDIDVFSQNKIGKALMRGVFEKVHTLNPYKFNLHALLNKHGIRTRFTGSRRYRLILKTFSAFE